MPQHQIGSQVEIGFVDKRRATAGSAGDANDNISTPANYASIADLDARLNALSASTYPQSVLDQMTMNDKVYALRLFDDAATL